MKPTGPLPTEIRASFTAAIIAAKIGADAEVPPLFVMAPSSAVTVFHPFAATSGIARPDALKRPFE